MNNYFVGIGEKLAARITHQNIDHTKEATCDARFSFTPVTQEDIGKIIDDLDTSKAPGWDQIEAKTVKECKREIQSVLCKLTN
ncbi:hypothetical protein JTB14_004728 [Gonioctena quinquepunctata]|nr:hypothetical protein JTB14_004728 [Gonioctena quinquepunctata]